MKQTDFRAYVTEVKPKYQAIPEESRGTFNDFLKSLYVRQTGQTDFRTFKTWKEAGFSVKKGESSFPVFSRPIGAIKAEKGQTPNEGEMNYFGIAHLFHAGQVEPIKK